MVRMTPARVRMVNWPSIPRRRKNRMIRRRMNRQRAVAARAAADSCLWPLSRAARAALASWAQRRAAGVVAAGAGPPPGPEAETAAPDAVVVATAASGELATFSVELSRAAWLAAPPPGLPLAVPPVPPVPVLAAGVE